MRWHPQVKGICVCVKCMCACQGVAVHIACVGVQSVWLCACVRVGVCVAVCAENIDERSTCALCACQGVVMHHSVCGCDRESVWLRAFVCAGVCVAVCAREYIYERSACGLYAFTCRSLPPSGTTATGRFTARAKRSTCARVMTLRDVNLALAGDTEVLITFSFSSHIWA